MLEGESVMAHSSGGAITAFKCVPVEFVARSSLEKDIWVKGINTMLQNARACAMASKKSVSG